jgi:hypothetical protein
VLTSADRVGHAPCQMLVPCLACIWRSVVLFPCKHLALCDSCLGLGGPAAAAAAAASAAAASAAAAAAAAAGGSDGSSAAATLWQHQCCPLCGVFVQEHIAGVMLPA